MFMQQRKPKELKELLLDLIDTAEVMLSLLRVLKREDGLGNDITVKAVEAVMGYIVPKVMDQEGDLECILQNMEPAVYAEWLKSIAPQSCVFQGRKELAQAREARIAAAGF